MTVDRASAVSDPRGAASSSATQFRIHGMDCAEEVAILKRAVGPVVGGADLLSFDILNARMSVAPAVETADIALMSDDLARIPWVVRHSRRALGIVKQNIGLSLSIKALLVVLTFAGAASLWAAIAADMGVSLAVISNALRLLRPSRNVGGGSK